MIYVVENKLDEAIDASSFQMAMFNAAGKITSLSVLQFGGVAAGRTKVVQFDLPSPPCEDLSRILVNELDNCQSGGQDSDVCLSQLVTRNMTEIGFE